MPRVIIRHQTGSKAHQDDYLDFVESKDVLIGRDQQTCAVAYEENRDETVSRQHARIIRNDGDPYSFTIENFSRNGTFVDGRKIDGPAALHHGSTVRFGQSGPSFIFEIDPPPSNNGPRPTVMDFGGVDEEKPARIYITHIIGSKAPGTDALDFTKSREVLIGRDPACAVVFDDAREQKVSREHARIVQSPAGPNQYTIENLSRNGTLVNGRKIGTITRLRHGSEVRLGPNGPSFQFKLDPPPISRETTIESSGVEVDDDDPWWVKRGTIADSDTDSEPEEPVFHLHKVAIPASLLLLAALIAIAVFTYLRRPLDAAAIVKANGDAVVSIEVNWRLFDPESGRQAYHWYTPDPSGGETNGRLPVFVRSTDGGIQPLLILDDEKDTNKAIAGRVLGTGCVVHENGFVLTSSLVAAPFNGPYIWAGIALPGLLIDTDEHTISQLKEFPKGWVPTGSHYVINRRITLDDVRMGHVERAGRKLEGRIDSITIGFSGSDTSINAKLVGVAANGRIALLKADPLNALHAVGVTANKTNLGFADRVYLIGYSAAGGAKKKSMVRLTSILKVVEGAPKNSASCGGCYVVSDSNTDAGFNGAPAFDDHGRLVGVFLILSGGKEKSFTVVQIEQASDLLGLSQK